MRQDDANNPEDEDALRRALTQAPRGAFALAGLAVALVIAAWFIVYALVFLPRGMVG